MEKSFPPSLCWEEHNSWVAVRLFGGQVVGRGWVCAWGPRERESVGATSKKC